MSRFTVTLLLALAAAASGRPTWADCVSLAPKIVWSYPADGATDVPTNAHVVILTSLSQHMPAITVNGETFFPGPLPFSYEPALAPRTAYTVNVPGKAQRPGEMTLRFTTGDGPVPAFPVPTPVLARVSRTTAREMTPVCREAFHTIDCFDTGQNTHVIFESEAQPLFWLVERESPFGFQTASLWPGTCGAPEDFTWDRMAAGACGPRYRLTAVGSTGQSASVEIPCDTPGLAAGPPPAGIGCSLSSGRGGAASWWWLLCAAGLLAIRRRR